MGSAAGEATEPLHVVGAGLPQVATDSDEVAVRSADGTCRRSMNTQVLGAGRAHRRGEVRSFAGAGLPCGGGAYRSCRRTCGSRVSGRLCATVWAVGTRNRNTLALALLLATACHASPMGHTGVDCRLSPAHSTADAARLRWRRVTVRRHPPRPAVVGWCARELTCQRRRTLEGAGEPRAHDVRASAGRQGLPPPGPGPHRHGSGDGGIVRQGRIQA